MPTTPYRPIDCAVHDRLESWAVRRVQVAVRWTDGDGVEHRDHSVIQDVYAREGEEFAVLESGARIRLDRILELRPD
jgi:Rho-binding antiterminator